MRLSRLARPVLGLFLFGIMAISPSVFAADFSADEFKALVQQDLGQLNKHVKETMKAKEIMQSKGAALMIAHYAQRQMGKDPAKDAQLATLRDAALKVMTSVGTKKFKDATEQVKAIKADIAADSKASTKTVALEKNKVELNDLMAQFKKTSAGGLNLEDDLKTMADKLKDPAQVPLMAARLIAISELTAVMQGDDLKGSGKKSPDNWKKFSKLMQDASEETYKLSKEAKPDVKKLQAAIGKINASCTECHNVFKQ